MGEREFRAKDSRAKASKAGRGLGMGMVQKGQRVGWGCSGGRDGERPGHQGTQLGSQAEGLGLIVKMSEAAAPMSLPRTAKTNS